jgi:hypothetical protein
VARFPGNLRHPCPQAGGGSPECGPGTNFLRAWGCVFFDSPQAIDASLESGRRYDAIASGFAIYAYVNNDPLNRLDPFGTCDDPQGCGGSSVGGGSSIIGGGSYGSGSSGSGSNIILAQAAMGLCAVGPAGCAVGAGITAGQIILGGAAAAGAGAIIMMNQAPSETPPAATESGPPASAPVGNSTSPIEVQPGTNEPATIGNTPYSGHSIDRMQGRGDLSP